MERLTRLPGTELVVVSEGWRVPGLSAAGRLAFDPATSEVVVVEFVDDGVNGFVVDPEPEAVANAVRLLTNDANRLQTMSLAARATAERYTWQQALDTFDKALIGPTASAA